MKGTRVHHDKEAWDGTIIDAVDGKTVRVKSDGGFIGFYKLKEFSLLLEPPGSLNIITNPGELLDKLKNHVFQYQPGAVASIRASKHMNDVPADLDIDPRIVDATLIDFLNFVGACYGVDYAIYTSDLPAPGLLDKMARAAGAGDTKAEDREEELRERRKRALDR